MWSRNLVNEEALAHWGAVATNKKKQFNGLSTVWSLVIKSWFCSKISSTKYNVILNSIKLSTAIKVVSKEIMSQWIKNIAKSTYDLLQNNILFPICHVLVLMGNYHSLNKNTAGYARTNVIGSRTFFVIASVCSSIHCHIRIWGNPFQAHSLQQSYHPTQPFKQEKYNTK